MRFVPTSDMSSDCTMSYHVEVKIPMKVREFVEEILTERTDEWGTIYFMEKPCEVCWHNPQCEYGHGKKVVDSWWDEIMRNFGERTIKRIESVGGWTKMDYLIYMA